MYSRTARSHGRPLPGSEASHASTASGSACSHSLVSARIAAEYPFVPASPSTQRRAASGSSPSRSRTAAATSSAVHRSTGSDATAAGVVLETPPGSPRASAPGALAAPASGTAGTESSPPRFKPPAYDSSPFRDAAPRPGSGIRGERRPIRPIPIPRTSTVATATSRQKRSIFFIAWLPYSAPYGTLARRIPYVFAMLRQRRSTALSPQPARIRSHRSDSTRRGP